MEWQDAAIVLEARPHGETSVVAQLLTQYHGRHAGLVRGGRSRRGRSAIEPGYLVMATWRARLAEHLGTFVVEPERHVAARLLDHPQRLAALASACAVLSAALPERAPYPGVYAATAAMLQALADGADAIWPAVYVKWELGLLSALGYGLEFDRCAATGRRDDLAYVSPRTGRAVSREAGSPYHDRLLSLPAFLWGDLRAADSNAVIAGLALAGYFLEHRLFAALNRPLPPQRARLVSLIAYSE